VETAVLHVGGLHYASEKTVVERVLWNRAGVVEVEANPVAQTATVTFDPNQTCVAALRKWVADCGYPCGRVGAGPHLRPTGRASAV
jgi:Cu2+-exporting ATPase